MPSVLDLGQEWEKESGLPLPLGINVMRRDLGEETHRRLSQALRDSIDYAHAHVDEALEYAMRYGRGIDKETCRRFVLMYVNEHTKRLGDEGQAALRRLYQMAHAKGLIAEIPPSTRFDHPIGDLCARGAGREDRSRSPTLVSRDLSGASSAYLRRPRVGRRLGWLPR